ncbi:molybdate ABC transporter substrate-binding protein [Salirhabdus salicampi]|uniref:molybdate ABC transporter substrate-binding protein n=1 Tax=Salirhabdus salicampi TaxID=476102 RepID=UPI0020C29009|nr:molybdate ABC transporter substrate-binding protein [Salirhabdus salicampi]MCP8615645.1 molybdate ABC transporter substrate-binding protein [Salirhabdus salicampi]
MKNFINVFLLLSLLFLTGCTNEKPTKITVSAASSMTESLMKLKDRFEADHPNITITYNFGGTGSLRKQIEQGAPVDLFFLASKDDYKQLEEGKYIHHGTLIFENQLVIVNNKEVDVNNFADFLHSSDGKVAIGSPEAVPAGTYAKQALQSLEVWDQLVENRIVFTKNVSHVLTLVEKGAVDVGIAYYSDATPSDVNILETIDYRMHEPIEYYLAIIANNIGNEEAVNTFYEYALNDKSLELYKDYGFQTDGRMGES